MVEDPVFFVYRAVEYFLGRDDDVVHEVFNTAVLFQFPAVL